MGNSFPVNKQTAVGLLMFLIFLWTLSTFTSTNPKTPPTHIVGFFSRFRRELADLCA